MPFLLRRIISPHTLRHSKAVHLLQSGAPLLVIKDILGHTDVRTTHIYAETDLGAKLQALQQGGAITHMYAASKIPTDILDWLESI